MKPKDKGKHSCEIEHVSNVRQLQGTFYEHSPQTSEINPFFIWNFFYLFEFLRVSYIYFMMLQDNLLFLIFNPFDLFSY